MLNNDGNSMHCKDTSDSTDSTALKNLALYHMVRPIDSKKFPSRQVAGMSG